MNARFFAAGILACALLSACTAVPTATNLMVENRMNSALAGAGTREVLAKYGAPHYRVVIPRPRDMIEIWGYDMGNYWVNDAVFLVFRNGALVNVSKHPYEMLQAMHSLRIFGEGASFSRLAGTDSKYGQVSPAAPAGGGSLRERMSAVRDAAR